MGVYDGLNTHGYTVAIVNVFKDVWL